MGSGTTEAASVLVRNGYLFWHPVSIQLFLKFQEERSGLFGSKILNFFYKRERERNWLREAKRGGGEREMAREATRETVRR